VRLLLDGKRWDDEISEVVRQGDLEIWEIVNTTGEEHPIHLHLEAFQVLRRRSVGLPNGVLLGLLFFAGIGCCVAMSMPQVHIVALSVDLGCGPRAGGQMLSLMLLGGGLILVGVLLPLAPTAKR